MPKNYFACYWRSAWSSWIKRSVTRGREGVSSDVCQLLRSLDRQGQFPPSEPNAVDIVVAAAAVDVVDVVDFVVVVVPAGVEEAEADASAAVADMLDVVVDVAVAGEFV